MSSTRNSWGAGDILTQLREPYPRHLTVFQAQACQAVDGTPVGHDGDVRLGARGEPPLESLQPLPERRFGLSRVNVLAWGPPLCLFRPVVVVVPPALGQCRAVPAVLAKLRLERLRIRPDVGREPHAFPHHRIHHARNVLQPAESQRCCVERAVQGRRHKQFHLLAALFVLAAQHLVQFRCLIHSPRGQPRVVVARIFEASAAVRLFPEEFVHLSHTVPYKSDLLGHVQAHARRSTPAVR
mmetsp:Transcript_65904/g.157260  ORF Transcript_65904/g.157260 Transcript_65904/m.157260 type:complete len:240 (+) Transcript_65904:48-767(+)